jgi:hypothetical protein
MRVWEQKCTSERAAEPAAVQPASRRRYALRHLAAYHIPP